MKKSMVGLVLLLALVFVTVVGIGQVFAVPPPPCDFYGSTTTFHGQAITTADTVTAQDPDGVWCGEQYWWDTGQYAIHVYGDDADTPEDEGAAAGDTIRFYINGEKATVVSGSPVWSPSGSVPLELSVPLEVPDIAVSPTSIGFGDVLVDGSKDTVLTVSNVGTASLTVSDIVSSNPVVFAVTYAPGFPASIDTAASINVTVTFDPASEVTYADSLTITSDDPDEGTVNVALTGRGVLPLNITTTSLPDGMVDVAYSQTLTATGGVTPYTWAITAGNLPAGLTLDTSTAVISGTPTTPETKIFTVQVTDSAAPTPSTDTQELSITILPPPDITPPSAITSLVAYGGTFWGEVNLSWIAPGDDGGVGTASQYIIRYSTWPITEDNFASAFDVSYRTGSLTPHPAGTAESMIVTGLDGGQTYYFAIKTQDEVPNTSPISNVPSATASSGQVIPTLSQWGMIILSLLLGGTAIWILRRRRTAQA